MGDLMLLVDRGLPLWVCRDVPLFRGPNAERGSGPFRKLDFGSHIPIGSMHWPSSGPWDRLGLWLSVL